MKNFIKWILLLTLLLLIQAASQATTLLMPERQGTPGSLVRVDLAVEGADSLSGLEGLLEYDPTFLEFIRVEEEGAVHGFLVTSREKENQIAFSMARPEAIGEPYAVICGLTFRIRQSVQIGTSTEITWRTSRLFSVSTALIDHQVQHGVVRARDVACYPNPFTPGDGNGINDVVHFVLPQEMMPAAEVKIFAATGNLVRDIASTSSAYLQWDGKDDEGRMSKPGVYLYLLLVDGETLRKGTITLMR